MRMVSLLLTFGWLMAAEAMAGEPCKAPPACQEVQTCGSARCCARCGAASDCCKQCKIVCEMKDVKKTVWVVTCSEVCTVMPNCGHRCGCGCDNCKTAQAKCESCEDKDAGCPKHDPCAAEKNKHYVPPKCGRVREVKKLTPKEVVCQVPVYKCVVEYCCPQCDGQEKVAPKAAAPLPPAAPAPAPKTTHHWTPSEEMPVLK